MQTRITFPFFETRLLTNYPAVRRRPMDVPGSSPKRPNVRDLQRTFRRLLKNQQKIDNLIKKMIFRCNSYCLTHLLLFFYWENKYSNVLKEEVHWTSIGPSCGTSQWPNDGTFLGRSWEVGHICFLDSTQRHTKLTLTSYSSKLW